MIIAFAGNKGHGKSTACDILAKHGYQVINFADPLKMMAVELTGVPLNDCYDLEAKERERYFKITADDFSQLLKRYAIYNTPSVLQTGGDFFFKSLRQVLQFIGTELLREADKNYWINQLMSKIDPRQNYTVGDLRYGNEKDAIEAAGGVVIRVIRPSLELPKDTHPSELIDFDCRYTIINEDLKQFERDILAVAGVNIEHGKIL